MNCWVLPDAIVTGLGVTVMVDRAPAVPVALNVTGDPDRPVDVAVTVFVPAVVPSVSVVEAFPFDPVMAEVADREPPPAVMLNATLTPLTGFPLASFTITTRGLGSTVPTVPFWLSPESIVILDAVPGVTVTLAVPDALPEVATTVPVPAAVAVRSPDELIVPIPPVTDQVGVTDTELL